MEVARISFATLEMNVKGVMEWFDVQGDWAAEFHLSVLWWLTQAHKILGRFSYMDISRSIQYQVNKHAFFLCQDGATSHQPKNS